MSATWLMIWAALKVRRLQAVLVLVAAALSSALLAVSFTFLLTGNGQFLDAFEQVRGPDLLIDFRAGGATTDELQATALLPQVTAAAGPWPDAEVVLDRDRPSGPFDVVRVTGRSNPGGALDQIPLIRGRWPRRPSEIAISLPVARQLDVDLGALITAGASPSRPHLLVTGVAADLASIPAGLERAWVMPDDVGRLVEPGQSMGLQMAYRVRDAQAEGVVDRSFAVISERLPSTAYPVLLESSHDQRVEYNRLTDSLNTAVNPFSLFALAVAAVVFFNVITGARLAGYREIGVLQAIGFSPRRVSAVFLGMIVVPALSGCVLGGIAGAAGALVASASNAQIQVALPVLHAVEGAVLAALSVLLVAVLACWIPSRKASRIQLVRALAVGNAPAPTAKLVARLVRPGSLPPGFALGLHDALARPVRALLTGIGIMVAVITVLYAVQARTDLAAVERALRLEHGDVTFYRYATFPDDTLMRRLEARPETESVVASSPFPVQVQGIGQLAVGFGMRGQDTSTGFTMVSGRWFASPGEAVAGQGFMRLASLHLGDRVETTVLGPRPIPVQLRIVGTYLDVEGFGRVVRFNWNTLADAPQVQPQDYVVHLRRGAEPAAYARRVQDGSLLIHAGVNHPSSLIAVQQSFAFALPVLLALIALAGAFTTMTLNARERAIGIAALKALGMSRGQVLGMVLASGGILGLAGAIPAIPLGVLLLHASADFAARQYDVTWPPGWTQDPSTPGVLFLLCLGIGLALLGALSPARWAARVPTAQLLRAE
jgi:putative ABC transport system permease protein